MRHATIAAVVASALAPSGCTRQVGDRDDDLLAHRIEPCELLCKVQTDPVCGYGPTDAYDGQEGCVRECASVSGDQSWGWGYQQTTKKDACAAEWMAHSHCVRALSCEQQRVYFSDASVPPPPEQRPCWDEWFAMSICATEQQ
jgi:hypothetical protein